MSYIDMYLIFFFTPDPANEWSGGLDRGIKTSFDPTMVGHYGAVLVFAAEDVLRFFFCISSLPFSFLCPFIIIILFFLTFYDRLEHLRPSGDASAAAGNGFPICFCLLVFLGFFFGCKIQ